MGTRLRGRLGRGIGRGIALVGALVVGAGLVALGATVANQPASAATAVQTTYSPLGATANGPSGPVSAAFVAGPSCCPDTAVVLTPRRVIGEGDFQWMNLGLPWDGARVTSVRICYRVNTTTPGATYISQTRISDTTTPTSASVRLDDATDRNSATGTCYSVSTNFTPTGTLTLELKVVFGSGGDQISIGMVRLSGTSA
jgi:hypothetical protein